MKADLAAARRLLDLFRENRSRYADSMFRGQFEHVVPAMISEIADLRSEAELLKTCGVTELMARNPNVSAYVAEAEAKVACLTAERDAAVARAVTVKPLEWRNGVARTRWGIYRITDLGENWGTSGRFDVSFNNRDVGAADTQLDAERIVKNHYEVRIRAALIPAPDTLRQVREAERGEAYEAFEKRQTVRSDGGHLQVNATYKSSFFAGWDAALAQLTKEG